MTTMSSKFFPGHGESSSSIEADYLSLSVDSVHSLAELVSKALQLNERQCQDLSSKLVQTVKNIQKLVPPSGALKVLFGPALKNLYRVLEKAKVLVHQCCDPDWCQAAVFQIHNEGTFQEVLLEVGLSYNVIYELTKAILRDWVRTLNRAEDLRQSSLFLPASESEVREDQETLKRRLEQVAGTSDDQNPHLASYLLRKLECISAARKNEELSVPDALFWMNETEPPETWKFQRVIGRGSGASWVCRYEWLGIPCARKEFHCGVADGIFRREAAILAQLNHPNTVKFFCCNNGSEMGECFIAMELMEMSLDSLIESRGKAGWSFPILLVLDIMTQIARGVRYLHGLNIAHRDLKPQNVVVTETSAAHLEDFFCVKLVDFGMSKTKVQVSKSNSISIPGVGTTKYRAPEVFPQAQRVAPGLKTKVNWFQADAYSFGITCAVLLSVKEPFEDVPRSELYEKLLEGVRPELPGECPKALVGLLKDCWSTNPQSRPGFGEICCRLEQCKLQELLRGSCEGLHGVVGSEYIETVLMTQSHDYSDDRQSIILSELRPEKGFWSSIFSSLVREFWYRSPLLDGGYLHHNDGYLHRKVDRKIGESDVEPHIFSYNKLRIATRDFHKDMKLGETGFGAVYKGVLPNGSVVTVNISPVLDLGASEFWNEVLLFTEIKHEKLLTLKGCCLHDRKWLVVYEYMENMNVSQILLDKGPSRQMVAWPARLKICLGVAQGLHYLHALARPRIVHGNITARTIFLDRNFDLKIGGFSFALSFRDEESVIRVKHSHLLEGTMDYMAPEYINNRQLSEKVDVYSFGVLCLEIISGRHNCEMTSPPDQVYLLNWAWRLHEEDRLLELVDPILELTDVEVRDVQRVIKLCLMCLRKEAESRPSMARIVSILQRDSEWDGPVKRLGGHENGISSLPSGLSLGSFSHGASP